MTTRGRHEKDFPVRLVAAAIAIVLLLILVFQNAQTVSLGVLFWSIQGRLVWMLLAVAALGFLAGLVMPHYGDREK